MTDTAPVTVRFTNSMRAWVSSGATIRPSAQVGQSGQPSPDPVTRTAPPVTTMNPRATGASRVTLR